MPHQFKPSEYQLTKGDVELFHTADDLCFRLTATGCQAELRHTTKWGQKTYENLAVIQCAAQIDDWEADDVAWEITPQYTGFYHVWNPDVRKTVAAFLRPGDNLVVRWMRANFADCLKKSGFGTDEFELHIRRGEVRYGKLRKYVFLLGHVARFPDVPERNQAIQCHID